MNIEFGEQKMSKAIATKAAVYAAADALWARGIDPTYELIIAALGGGSNATVGPHLESWKQSSRPPAKPVPDSVEIRAKIFVEAVWTAAVQENLADIDHAKQKADASIEQAERALAQSIAISQGLEAERDGLLKRLAEIGRQCTELRFQLRQVDKLTIDLARTEQIAEERRVQCDKEQLCAEERERGTAGARATTSPSDVIPAHACAIQAPEKQPHDPGVLTANSRR